MRVEFNALTTPNQPAVQAQCFFQKRYNTCAKIKLRSTRAFTLYATSPFHALSGLISEKQLQLQSWIKMLIRVSWYEHEKLYNFIFFNF